MTPSRTLSHASRTPVRAPPYNPPACAKGMRTCGGYGAAAQYGKAGEPRVQTGGVTS